MIQVKLTLIPKEGETIAPLYVNEDYSLESADFPEGVIYYLLGFGKYFSTGRREILDVDYQTFWDNLYLAVGKYPFFNLGPGTDWQGINNLVGTVEIIEDE